MRTRLLSPMLVLAIGASSLAFAAGPSRPRAPELGIKVGVLDSGPQDAITDVAGVEVGQRLEFAGQQQRPFAADDGVLELGAIEVGRSVMVPDLHARGGGR